MNRQLGLSLLRSEFPNITGLPIDEWSVARGHVGGSHDVQFRAHGCGFVASYKAAANSEQLGTAIQALSQIKNQSDVPLVVVPYMGSAGRELCRAAGVAWIDLSGNAEIQTSSIHIRIGGEANRFKRSGRPESIFAAKSARVARVLLLDVARSWTQSELANATGLSAGYLSRLLPRYVEAGFLECKQDGRMLRYKVLQPDRFLDGWFADYDFNRHRIIRGHVASRSGVDLLRELSKTLHHHEVEYAVTGLAAAWLWEPFAAFRNVTLYVSSLPSSDFLAEAGFHVGERGSNTWLVVPDDPGVLDGVTVRDGVQCVTPVQAYLDLKSQPERSQEAREELRRVHLSWGSVQ
jgi:hypothetical protein